MIDREHISQPPLLPQVSKETIVERFGNSLEIDIEPQGKSLRYRASGLTDFLSLLSENGAPTMSLGGLRVLDLLVNEAQKRGKRLPPISEQDIDGYFKTHPIMNMIIDTFKRGKWRVSEKEARKMEAEIEYTPPSFEKFRSENPDLISHLEQAYNRNVQLAQKGTGYPRFQIEGWRIGALYTYELLRNQVEKERMKGLGL